LEKSFESEKATKILEALDTLDDLMKQAANQKGI
jgi:hypothetical protein